MKLASLCREVPGFKLETFGKFWFDLKLVDLELKGKLFRFVLGVLTYAGRVSVAPVVVPQRLGHGFDLDSKVCVLALDKKNLR